jgi:hypothetical protein
MVLWLSVVLVLQLQQRVQLVSLLVQEPTAATPHTPPEARLRLLLVVCVSFAFSFQFFTRLAAMFAEEVGGFGFLSFNFSLRAFPHDH